MRDDLLKDVLEEYISEVSIEKEDFVFIKDLTHDGIKIYRIYTSKKIDIENPPSEYFMVENHFIFLFDKRQKKVPIEELIRNFETNIEDNEGLYYDPEEWIILSCQGYFNVLKDTNYAPIDSLEKKIGEFKCY